VDTAVKERRSHERAAGPWRRPARASLRPGHHITLVNVSRGGALVDSRRPLRPGARVLLQIATQDTALGLSAVVLRCAVRAVSPIDGVLYRGALKFDERRDVTRELRTLLG
jgi:hypothetical protein